MQLRISIRSCVGPSVRPSVIVVVVFIVVVVIVVVVVVVSLHGCLDPPEKNKTTPKRHH